MKMDPKQSRDFEFDDGKVMQIIQFLKQARFFFLPGPVTLHTCMYKYINTCTEG